MDQISHTSTLTNAITPGFYPREGRYAVVIVIVVLVVAVAIIADDNGVGGGGGGSGGDGGDGDGDVCMYARALCMSPLTQAMHIPQALTSKLSCVNGNTSIVLWALPTTQNEQPDRLRHASPSCTFIQQKNMRPQRLLRSMN